MHRSLHKIVIALIVRQGKIIEIRAMTTAATATNGVPIMIAQGGPKAIALRTRPKVATIRINKLLIKLTDIQVDGRRRPIRIVIIAHCRHKIRLPTLDHLSQVAKDTTPYNPIIADHRKADAACCLFSYIRDNSGCRNR